MIDINKKSWEEVKYEDVLVLLDEIEEENFFFEFKNDEIRNEKLTKEICAFANTYGGYILLGVEDDKRISGCAKWNEERIVNVIRNTLSPTPNFDIKKFVNENNAIIYVIKVEKGLVPPYITNNGEILERLSSVSSPVKDAYKLNEIYNRSLNQMKQMEHKILNEKPETIPQNLYAYYDMGFALITKNPEKIYIKLLEYDFETVKDIERLGGNKYSISLVGESIFITIGESPGFQNDMPADLHNFIEIKPDGSVRCRMLIFSNGQNGEGEISNLLIGKIVFEAIYRSIFEEEIFQNFIGAYKYEKLTVFKQFVTKLETGDSDVDKGFKRIFLEHEKKFGSNRVVSGNRIPMNGLLLIDRAYIEKYNDFNSSSLYDELFYSNYTYIGYFNFQQYGSIETLLNI